jgi:uncharacterized phage protein (predicted DNA packaging)
MTLELALAKKYLRVDGDDENDLITTLMGTAASYMKSAVDGYETKAAADADFAKLGNQAELTLLTELYENRNAGAQEAKDYSYTVRSIITQLQTWGDSA